MKYMFIMRATDEAVQASKGIPFEQIINQMGAYNESMINAGVMIGGEGLADVSEGSGLVVDFSEDPPLVTDGPYGETHELFNGYWIVQVGSREEAAEWASRAPLGPGSKLEVRRVNEATDFADFADNEYIRKEELWRQEEENLTAENK
ncbi:YciI family protein [Arthrobacter sp. zg-Y179]|uniref:YciI family protein n=1 Tax=Arthrobacter sp. zg-Y179 TaxID=2894188 RepID=UPI001E378937|nr:YciI family protein [Arthrobacter sp. zg-Y179]MCC9174615.1 YciI family protein [Arthrobacter sp. zg-Y179]